MKKDIAPAKNVPAAFVLNWTSTRVEILCPFTSCDQKVHSHGYTAPTTKYLNTRRAHCYPPRQLEYRLLFPYENDPLVRDFGFLLDRQNLKWKSISHRLENPRTNEDEELLSTLLAKTRVSDPSPQYFLESEDARLFVSSCISNEYLACKHMLETSEQLELLVKGKVRRSGQTALSLVCEEGHLEIATLLHEHGAELESVDNDGRTPLMLATYHGYGQIASYLAWFGASLFVKDKKGTTLIQTAKTAIQKLNEMEWSRVKIPIIASEIGSSEAINQVERRNCALEKIKERKEGLNCIIDLYTALEPERKIEKSALRDGKLDDSFCIIQKNNLVMPRVSLSKVIFEANMAKPSKTFAYLDRGRPFEHIQAASISGYTAGTVGDNDGCLNRELWTSRVMKYCKVIGHDLARTDQYGRAVPETFHASHAEKQLIAYFLWMHTIVDQKFEESSDEGEMWGSTHEICQLQSSKPDVASVKKDIYVSREPCPDCKSFQQRIFKEEGILFNFFYIKPIEC